MGRQVSGSAVPFFFASPAIDYAEVFIAGFEADRPLYLCRTLSELRGAFRKRLKSDANTARLAAHLAGEIELLQPEGPVHLGGFCQGAVLMLAVADHLALSGREIGLFVIIERVFPAPLPYAALVAWTSTSAFSGAGHFASPDVGAAVLFPKGVCFYRHDAGHFAALQGAAGCEMAACVEAAMASPPTARPEAPRELASQAFQAAITAKGPRFAPPREEVAFDVTVRNESAMFWRARAFRLYARWLNLDGKTRTALAAGADLPGDLAPGKSARLTLQVPFPEKRLPHGLMLDVAEEGVAWFHWHGSRPWRRTIWPWPS